MKVGDLTFQLSNENDERVAADVFLASSDCFQFSSIGVCHPVFVLIYVHQLQKPWEVSLLARAVDEGRRLVSGGGTNSKYAASTKQYNVEINNTYSNVLYVVHARLGKQLSRRGPGLHGCAEKRSYIGLFRSFRD